MDAQKLLSSFLNANEYTYTLYWEDLSQFIVKTVRKAAAKRETGDLGDFEDDCIVNIWSKIMAIREGKSKIAIENLEAFIRAAVHNRYCDAIRKKRPKWYNKKLELLEIFSGKAGIKGVTLIDKRLCTYDSWVDDGSKGTHECEKLCNSVDNIQLFKQNYIENHDPNELATYQLACAILNYCGSAVDINTMTSCVIELTQQKDLDIDSLDAPIGSNDKGFTKADTLIAPDSDTATQICNKDWFGTVIKWFVSEFDKLSPKQKKAVLYAMECEEVLHIISAMGATALAKSLEITKIELYELLKTLPLPDAETAQAIGCEARAVPSIRFKAWEKIQRRVKKSGLDDN